MSGMMERVIGESASVLRENCTNVRGECYVHGAIGPCSQEGGWATEVDGEFDLEVIARAALTAAKQIADELGNEAASVFLDAVLED